MADRKYVQKGFEHDVIHMQTDLCFQGFTVKRKSVQIQQSSFVFSQFCKFWDHCLQ